MSTYIDGIAASENIDTSCERIIITGLDISSLVGSVFNWEHKSDQPSQIVGKILKAKKILSEQDCEDERQAYYWSKCTAPYLYVMGELFDDYKESAKEVAGMFRYDAEHKDKSPTDTIGFSIEGAKIDKKGMDIVRSIARKVTITALPCNKAAVAEMVPAAGSKKDSLDEIFKTEHTTEIQIFSEQNTSKLLEMLKKEDPCAHAKILGIEPMKKAEAPKKAKLALVPKHVHLGQTKSGKEIMSHKKAHEYEGWSAQDHKDASNRYYEEAHKAKDPAQGRHYHDRMRMHSAVGNTADDREKRTGLKKALSAGSGLGAPPATLAQGAALPKQNVDKPIHNVTRPDKGWGGIKHKDSAPKAPGFGKIIYKKEDEEQLAKENPKKSKAWIKTQVRKKWIKKADTLYDQWEKKEEFRAFMQKRLPTLALGEIDAIGKTIALSKSLKPTNPFLDYEEGRQGSSFQKKEKK